MQLAAPAPEQKKQPSRNARRKAAKRRLRREGLLPGGTRPPGSGGRLQMISEAPTPAAVGPPSAQFQAPAADRSAAELKGRAHALARLQELKQRGQSAACRRHQTAAPAVTRPHVHFGVSDDETGEEPQLAALLPPLPQQQQTPAMQQQMAQQHSMEALEKHWYHAQPWDYNRQHGRQQKKAGRLGQSPGTVRLPPRQDDRPRPLPPIDPSSMQALMGEPQVGDVLAYRLLEISEDFTPQARSLLLQRSDHCASTGCSICFMAVAAARDAIYRDRLESRQHKPALCTAWLYSQSYSAAAGIDIPSGQGRGLRHGKPADQPGAVAQAHDSPGAGRARRRGGLRLL